MARPLQGKLGVRLAISQIDQSLGLLSYLRSDQGGGKIYLYYSIFIFSSLGGSDGMYRFYVCFQLLLFSQSGASVKRGIDVFKEGRDIMRCVEKGLE